MGYFIENLHLTQNAFIERRGQTLQNMAEAIMSGSRVPDHYWGKAILCTNFYLNILWHSGINNIPYTIWTGRKPNLKFLHVFGSPACVHIPKETRRKGERKAKLMYFLGYQQNRRAHRFGLPKTNKVVISSSASFNKHAYWDQISMPPETIIHTHDIQQNGGNDDEDSSQPEQGIKEESEPVELQPDSELPSSSEERETPEEERVIPRRSSRERRPPERYQSETYFCLNVAEPETYEDICKMPKVEQDRWKEALEKELNSLKQLRVRYMKKLWNLLMPKLLVADGYLKRK